MDEFLRRCKEEYCLGLERNVGICSAVSTINRLDSGFGFELCMYMCLTCKISLKIKGAIIEMLCVTGKVMAEVILL